MHGNRDFLLGEDFAQRTGVKLLPDPVLVDLYGVPTLLSHGDVFCTEDTSYQQLRSIVRQPAWQRRFLSLPLAARRALASAARAGSKAHTERTIPTIMDVNPDAVLRAFRATGARRLIHGHTHRPAVHPAWSTARTPSAWCWRPGTKRRAAWRWTQPACARSPTAHVEEWDDLFSDWQNRGLSPFFTPAGRSGIAARGPARWRAPLRAWRSISSARRDLRRIEFTRRELQVDLEMPRLGALELLVQIAHLVRQRFAEQPESFAGARLDQRVHDHEIELALGLVRAHQLAQFARVAPGLHALVRQRRASSSAARPARSA